MAAQRPFLKTLLRRTISWLPARLFGAGLSRGVAYWDVSRRRAIQLKTRTLATRMKPRIASPLP